MKGYDLVFVVGYFRTAMSFLSVIRALGKSNRIAILPVEADPAMRQKTGEAHAVYLDLCRQFGADVLGLGEPARAELLVIQQFPYPDELAQAVLKGVESKERTGLLTLAMAGLEKHDAFLRQFDIRKVYVPSRRFMDFLLEKREARARWEGIQIKEVGLPFAQYPVFPDFKVDWIIAAPTMFSFHTEEGKQQFLFAVNRLLEQISPADVVVYKPHNGNRLDYFAPRLHYWMAGLITCVPWGSVLFELALALPWSWLRAHTVKVRTSLLHRRILRRAVSMGQITPYSEMSLEAFLPGVRKGVIGGLSNTIWGTLYFDLPFYNCVDGLHRQGSSKLLKKSSDSLLDLNLQYFGVPYCNGDMDIDNRNLGIVRSDEQQGDLVTSITEDLGHLCLSSGVSI